jgi:hypothetical protein
LKNLQLKHSLKWHVVNNYLVLKGVFFPSVIDYPDRQFEILKKKKKKQNQNPLA